MNIKYLTILSVTFILFFLSNNSVSANTVVFSEDFSNGFGKWQAMRNNFSLWSIIENQANVVVNKRATLTDLVPKDEYWNHDWKKIIYELKYKYNTGADKNIVFGYKDNANWYGFHFVGNSYILSHVKNGKVSWDTSAPFFLASNTYHDFSISLDEGHIVVYHNGGLLLDIIDPTFDDDYGKIGLRAGAGSVFPTIAYYDSIVVKLISDAKNKLEVTSQKQSDPTWATQEYDSALTWSPNASQISDWGCVISSVSIIMNYHGINKMPDGKPVNPSTINSWLKSQVDGYVVEGLVNWSAITRLTKKINEVYSTPKLEYSRFSGSSYSTTISEIQNNKPVILQIPGHFLVGNGYTEDETDLFISDPAYSYEKFSQHQTILLSTRTFQPTFTDLSYLHIINNPDLNVEITTDAGEIDKLQSYEEFITSANDSSLQSPKLTRHEIEKPKSGKYFVTITNVDLQSYNLTIFAYDDQGEVSDLSYTGVVGVAPTILEIDYKPNGVSSITTTVNFNNLKDDLNYLYENKNITKHYAYQELLTATDFAINDTTQQTERHIDKLSQLLEWYSLYIDPKTKTILKLRLEEIRGII